MMASKRILLLACAVVIGACASPPPTPLPVATLAIREVTFQTEDGVTLSGTLFSKGTVGVVLSHMFPTDQISWHAFARTLTANGYMALAYDFRGYNESGGEKQISQIDRDVRAAAEFLRQQGAQRIVLIGASMGGTASAKVAGTVGADGLVVVSSPQAFQGLAVSEADLRSFNGPSLWIGSRGDAATVDTEAMYGLANDPKTLHVYGGSAHGTFIFDTADGPDLSRRIIEFLAGNLPPDA